MSKLAPVLLFSYNRLDELKLTVANLQSSQLANETILYLFSDGPKAEEDSRSVEKVREFLRSINGFKQIIYKFSDENKGLAPSIIAGVTEVLEYHGSAIILEDDLLVSTNFLVYMNKTLDYYQDYPNISSVCGFSNTIATTKLKDYPYDIYFAKRSSSWGWGTWKAKWEDIDWEVKDFDRFSKNSKERNEFNKWGSDMFSMLKQQQERSINSWAIRYSYHQHKHDLWSVFPMVSKVRNIGFNADATHTKGRFNRFDITLDESGKTDFMYLKDVLINKGIIKQFRAVNSLKNRIKYKILNLLWPS